MNKVFFMVLVTVTIFFLAAAGQAMANTSASYTTSGAALDKKDLEAMESKVDTAIKVLGVIKEELKTEKSAKASTGIQPEEQWTDSLQKNIQRIKKVWSELKEIRDEEIRSSGGTPPSKAEDEAWKAEMKDKLDKSIKAMEVIKEELEKEAK